MGEYVKYKREKIKIGTCENLYYATYPKLTEALKAGLLRTLAGNLAPSFYVKPDSGFRFRFPFPDEDHLPLENLGRLNDFHRGVPLTLENGEQMEITQQKLVHRESDGKLCLALVCRDPSGGNSYRLEDDEDVRQVLKGLVRHHIAAENNPEKKSFYRQIGARILKGYRLKPPSQKLRVLTGKNHRTGLSKRKQGRKPGW